MLFAQAFDPLRSLKVAWRLLLRAPATVLVGGLLLGYIAEGGWEFLLPWMLHSRLERLALPGVPLWLPFWGSVSCLWAVLFVFSSWLEVGFARAVAQGLETGKGELGKVFSGADRFLAMLLARLLSSLAIGLSILPFAGAVAALSSRSSQGVIQLGLALGFLAFSAVWFVFALYIGLGLYLVNPIIALEDCSVTESIARSWRLARGHRRQLFWFLLLQFLLGMAGVCLCLVGQLLTCPLERVMCFEAYVALTRGDQYPQWWIGGAAQTAPQA